MKKYEITKLAMIKIRDQVAEILDNMPEDMDDEVAWNAYCSTMSASTYINEIHTILAMPNMQLTEMIDDAVTVMAAPIESE